MTFRDPIQAPLHVPSEAVFDTAAREALRAALVPGDRAEAGDFVGVVFPVLSVYRDRLRTMKTMSNDALFITHRGPGAYDYTNWRDLFEADQARMARLLMALTTSPAQLEQSGIDDLVTSMTGTRSYIVGLEVLVTANAMVLSSPGWQDIVSDFGAGVFPIEDCFTVMPHAPATSAHDARRIGRAIAADLAVIECFTQCGGVRTGDPDSIAPSLVLPPVPL